MAIKSCSNIYYTLLKKNHLQQDPRQSAVLSSFDRLQKKLTAPQWFFNIKNLKVTKDIRGIYLWGKVGIGKTFLMDCFFDSLSTTKKRRIHFHHFMQEIHFELQKYSGYADPLLRIAKAIAKKNDVLCLDEFFVSDIVDAMLLAELFKALFKQGIFFVTTSNIPPHQLYLDGLQRASFLPAIALLQKNLEIIHLMSETDYRLQHITSKKVYYTPLNAAAQKNLEILFESYADNHVSTQVLSLLGRKIKVIQLSTKAVWFSFETLCGALRCKQDYLALVQQFTTLFLSDVPLLNQRPIDEVTRFIQLIDILYDTKTKLIISAASMPQLLYTQGKLTMNFQRTISRLIEMQSLDYFDLNRP